MSAYMPVKDSWRLESCLPSRWGVGRRLRPVGAGLALVAAVAITVIAPSGLGRSAVEEVPSASSGVVASLGASVTRDHGFVVVQGEAANRGSKPLRNIEATAELFDQNGSLRGVESALVESPTIAAHEESAFVIRMPDPGDVRSFRVRFRPLGGAGIRK